MSATQKADRSDRVSELEAERDAALARAERAEEALGGLVESLRWAEHVPLIDPVNGAAVEALGRRIGFGALMSSASASWAAALEARGMAGGEFIAGPCRSVLKADLCRARAVLTRPEAEEGESRHGAS